MDQMVGGCIALLICAILGLILAIWILGIVTIIFSYLIISKLINTDSILIVLAIILLGLIIENSRNRKKDIPENIAARYTPKENRNNDNKK